MAIIPERALAMAIPEVAQTYTQRDAMIYALGIGIGHDPMDEGQLGFVYERGLKAVPTMAVVLGETIDWVYHDDLGIDVNQSLHGAERVILHRPLPPSGRVAGRMKITGLSDKGAGRGAVVVARKELTCAETGVHLATVERTAFARADGGFGGTHGVPPEAPHPLPERAPDHSIDLPTIPQAALLYRLSGDYIPLHADPALARAAGFERPILHGLCSLGIACHAVLRLVCDYDPSRIAEIGCRFTAPAYPGETLTVDLWRDGATVSFRATVRDRGITAISNGRAILRA